jgi:hypothetical protein
MYVGIILKGFLVEYYVNMEPRLNEFVWCFGFLNNRGVNRP